MFNLLDKHLPSSLEGNSEKMAFGALAGCICLMLVSIAASQILLAAALFASIPILRRDKGLLHSMMWIFLPLVVFCLWTTIAALASHNVLLGLTITKKFYLFLLVPLVPVVARGENRLTWIHKAIFAVASISALLGLGQYIANPQRDLLHRISGFMGHWMTFSGLLMLVLVLLVAYALCAGRRSYKWAVPIAIFIILALILSQTRMACMGAIAGISVLILIRRPRAFAGFIILILILYFVSPSSIKQRFQSGFDPNDPNTRNRIELFHTSVRLIQDNPWLGVGPKNVSHEALKYRGHNEFPDWMYMHMHNNFLQIAAEIGIPGLLLWLWLMIRLAWDSLRIYRYANSNSFTAEEGLRKEALTASSAALGAWVALIVAGMFEYNFGDSEVLMLFLFIMSSPYAFRDALNKPNSKAQRLEDSKVDVF